VGLEEEARVVSDEQHKVAEELRRIREGVRGRALIERSPSDVLPAAAGVRTSAAPTPETPPAAEPPVARPDGASVNALWDTSRVGVPGGLKGVVVRFVRRLIGPSLDAQVAFNSRQVQLDNEILAYIDARLDATHRHYDAVLGIHGRHMEDIDERHLILQEEVVAHVHDLVRRIDLVLSESERGRLSLEFALREVRERLTRLEARLSR
jgi:hypothetical protein